MLDMLGKRHRHLGMDVWESMFGDGQAVPGLLSVLHWEPRRQIPKQGFLDNAIPAH